MQGHIRFTRLGWPAAARGVGLALALTLLPVGVVLAAAPGTWSPTDSMPSGVQDVGQTARLLTTGKVLVAGGSFSGAAVLFDPLQPSSCCREPELGAWTVTGSMITGRANPTATLLADGRVLVAGGVIELPSSQGEAFTTSAELYDPASGTWRSTGSMSVPRAAHTATLLPNGNVLVAGGSNNLASAELYNPVTGTWSPAGPMTVARESATATLLTTGKVLVAGGIVQRAVTASTDLYDPSTNTWSSGRAMHVPRNLHTATLLANGKVLVASGAVALIGPVTVSAELYDPAAGTWTVTGNLSAARTGHSATLLASGFVLAFGGESPPTANAELYDPTSGGWRATGQMSRAHAGQPTSLLPNGNVLAAGGTANGSFPEVYTPPVAPALASTCVLSAAGLNQAGHAFINVAARNVASGLQSVKVLQATNANVALPKFPLGSRDPAVVTATKVNVSEASTLKLSVTNSTGTTITCDPVMTTLVGERHGKRSEVFTGLMQAESHVLLKNDTPGVERLDLRVNGQQFRLDDLKDGEQRTLDISSAMHPGDHNTVLVRTRGPRDASALLVISN